MMGHSQIDSTPESRGQRPEHQGYSGSYDRDQNHAPQGSQNYGASGGQGVEPRGYGGNYRGDGEESRERSYAYGYGGNSRRNEEDFRGQETQMPGRRGEFQSSDLESRGQRDGYQRQGSEPFGYGDDRQGEKRQNFHSESRGYGTNYQAPIENRQSQQAEPRSYESELRGYGNERASGGNQPSERSESRGFSNRRGPIENMAQNSEPRGYGGSPRGYSDHQIPRPESRSYREDSHGTQEDHRYQKPESHGHVEEFRGRRETQQFQGTDSRGHDAYREVGNSQNSSKLENQNYHSDSLEKAPQSQTFQLDSSVSHSTLPSMQRSEYQGFGSEPHDHGYSRDAPSKPNSSGWDSYNQSSKPNAQGMDSNEMDPTLDFTFEDKLFVSGREKIKSEDVFQLLKSFGATSAETVREDATSLVTKVQFKTKEEAEKVFAIWHGMHSLLFQCRLFFTRTLNPQSRERSPTSSKLLVSGFPHGIDEFTVYDLFRTVGPIYSCTIFYNQLELEHPRVALHYIKDELIDQAIAKFNGYSFQGATLRVEVTTEDKIQEYAKRSQEPVKAKESYRVEVTGFPSGTDQETISKLFRSVGEIVNMDLDVSNSKCIITYDTAMGAYGSISRFNNHQLGVCRITVKEETGRPSSKPFASIPLSAKSPPVAPPAVPTSRDATKSRWNRPADESSGHRRRNAPSGSNTGSQYGEEKPSGSFGFNDFSFDKPQSSTPIQHASSWDSPVGPSQNDHRSAPAEPPTSTFAKPSWDAPVVDSNPRSAIPSWDAPVGPSQNDHRSAPAEPPSSTFAKPSWDAPVIDSNPKSAIPSWDAPVGSSHNDHHSAPAEPSSSTFAKPSWDAPVVDSNPKSAIPSWDAPVDSKNASRNVLVNEPRSTYPSNQEGLSKSDLCVNNKPSEPKLQELSGSNLQSSMSLEQFKGSELYAPFLALLKASQPILLEASAPTLDGILKKLFLSEPHLMSTYIKFTEDLALGAKKAEVYLKETHQYSMSDEAYKRMKETSSDVPCNSEYLPLASSKENGLQTLMLAPKQQSYATMSSLLSQRLDKFGVQDPKAKADLISKYCSLRLMMVAYCYDDVLRDLYEKYIVNQPR